MITKASFDKLFPKAIDGSYEALEEVIRMAELRTDQRLACFLAQFGHESAGFSRVTENLNYTSAKRICQVWPSRFKSETLAAPYVRNPEGLANRVYAHRMGNGAPDSGDGWRYRGRGWAQLTGKDNYERFAQWLGREIDPEQVAQQPLAALAAAWFWADRGLNALADRHRLTALTQRINGGTTGLAARVQLYEEITKELKR